MKKTLLPLHLFLFLAFICQAQSSVVTDSKITSVNIACFNDHEILGIIARLDSIAQEFVDYVHLNNNGSKRLIKILPQDYRDQINYIFSSQDNIVKANWMINIDNYVGTTIMYDKYPVKNLDSRKKCSLSYPTEIGNVIVNFSTNSVNNDIMINYWHENNTFKFFLHVLVEYDSGIGFCPNIISEDG